MTVHIDPVGGVLLVVALAVGYFVHKHTQQAPAGKGAIVGAIVCATSVLTALVLILGGDHTEPPGPAPTGGGTPYVPASPPTPGR
ncbi:hypothetical protein [Streptomyces sp. NPDC050564]|uniref:hypothetical protein n=1 Tax=Streptomyces sp. NPDC050564 TaxID=3365631 RepID=UPI0037AA75C8